jgi:hypothetical protein
MADIDNEFHQYDHKRLKKNWRIVIPVAVVAVVLVFLLPLARRYYEYHHMDAQTLCSTFDGAPKSQQDAVAEAMLARYGNSPIGADAYTSIVNTPTGLTSGPITVTQVETFCIINSGKPIDHVYGTSGVNRMSGAASQNTSFNVSALWNSRLT